MKNILNGLCPGKILRLPHRNDAKIAKICNLWTFWSVIQPILGELQAKTSRGCRFLLFQHHSYEVTLKGLFKKKKTIVKKTLFPFAFLFATFFFVFFFFLSQRKTQFSFKYLCAYLGTISILYNFIKKVARSLVTNQLVKCFGFTLTVFRFSNGISNLGFTVLATKHNICAIIRLHPLITDTQTITLDWKWWLLLFAALSTAEPLISTAESLKFDFDPDL